MQSIEVINLTLGKYWTVVPPEGTRMRCPFYPVCDFHSLAPAAAVDNAPCAWRLEAPPAAPIPEAPARPDLGALAAAAQAATTQVSPSATGKAYTRREPFTFEGVEHINHPGCALGTCLCRIYRARPKGFLTLVAIALLATIAAAPACGNVQTAAAEVDQRGDAGLVVDQVDQVDAGLVVDQVDAGAELGAPASCSPPFDGSSCSSCSSSAAPLEAHCRSMLACVSKAWPCSPGADCWGVCQAAEGGSSQASACVAAIAVCP